MTSDLSEAPPREEPPPTPRRSLREMVVSEGRPLAEVIVVLAGLIRLFKVSSANQITVDEILYVNLGDQVRHGQIPPHFPAGEGNTHAVFLLHPPGYFMLEAAWQLLVGRPAELTQQIVRARGLNIVLAMVTAALLFALGRRLAGPLGGLVAALLFALDPFVLRQNGLAFLETATMMWAVAGYLVLVRLAQGDARRPRLAAAGGGLLLGIAVFTKDLVAIETVGALVVLTILGWGVTRRQGIIAVIASLVPYGIYAIACAGEGHFGQLVSQKTLGIRRALGITVTTGFNKAGSPSLVSNLSSDAATFIFSYLLVAVGSISGLLLLRSARTDHRIVGVFTVTAGIALGYCLAFGTIEEQFLYLLMIPAIVSAVIMVPRAWRRLVARRQADTRWVGLGLAALVVVTLGYNVGSWAHTRVGSVNQLAQFTSWMRHTVPPNAPVAYTDGVIQFATQADGRRPVALASPSSMKQAGVRYAVMATYEIENNYSFTRLAALKYYQSHGKVVFRTSGSRPLTVIETSDPTVW